MRKYIPGLLALFGAAFLLCGCSRGASLPDPTADPSGSPHEVTEDAQGTSDDSAESPYPGMVRSKLTGDWISEEAAAVRPIAVIIPNERAAVPHYNLSKASVLYEANVEGLMTRMMAIFEDWQNLDKIGNVRSLRTYFAYWSFEWDSILVHFGGPFFINDLVAEETTQNIDGSMGGADGDAFFRSLDRPDPHNAYTTGDMLKRSIERKGYDTAYRGLADSEHFRFADPAAPNTLSKYPDAKGATYIDMSGCYPLTRCYFEYNDKTGLYARSQYLSGATDGPHYDASGAQLTFKNVLVQQVKEEDLGEGYLAMQCHDSHQEGWFFTNGKGIHVTWTKETDYGATRFYDDNGNEVELNVGKTMICVVDDINNFAFH